MDDLEGYHVPSQFRLCLSNAVLPKYFFSDCFRGLKSYSDFYGLLCYLQMSFPCL